MDSRKRTSGKYAELRQAFEPIQHNTMPHYGGWLESSKYGTPLNSLDYQTVSNLDLNCGRIQLQLLEKYTSEKNTPPANRQMQQDLIVAVKRVRYEHDRRAGLIRCLLSDKHIDVNFRDPLGEAALHAACDDGIKSHVGAQLLLSDERCDVNKGDHSGHTALMAAVRWVKSKDDKHVKITRLLLAHPRIDVNKQNTWGQTALHKACGYGIASHVGAQLLLSDERCDINLQDGDSYTALMVAVRWVCFEDDEHARIIRLLLAHPRIDVNKQSSSGKTALHTACGYGIQSHVGAQLLLSDERCDVIVKDAKGKTALMMLAAMGPQSLDVKHERIKEFLLERSKNTEVTAIGFKKFVLSDNRQLQNILIMFLRL